VEEWQHHDTCSGTPQGGILSPILANISLHELDCFVESLIANFSTGKARGDNPEYNRISRRRIWLNKKIKQTSNTNDRNSLLKEKKDLLRQQMALPYSDQQDPEYRRLRDCRSADDFVLGATCPKSETEEIYRKIVNFLKDELSLNISQTKSGIKHNTEIIRFLGYDISIKNRRVL